MSECKFVNAVLKNVRRISKNKKDVKQSSVIIVASYENIVLTLNSVNDSCMVKCCIVN